MGMMGLWGCRYVSFFYSLFKVCLDGDVLMMTILGAIALPV